MGTLSNLHIFPIILAVGSILKVGQEEKTAMEKILNVSGDIACRYII